MSVRLSTGAVNALSNTGSLREIFANAVIGVFSGAKPENADAAETGSLLGYITLNGAAFTPVTGTNGLNWDEAVAGVCPKPSDEEWSIIPTLSGTTGWARIYDVNLTTGASETAVRIDCDCGMSTGELRFVSTALVSGTKVIFDSLDLQIPKS